MANIAAAIRMSFYVYRRRLLAAVLCCLITPISVADSQFQPFSWQRDAFFQALEQTFEQARQQPVEQVRARFDMQVERGRQLLSRVSLRMDGVPLEELKELEEAQFYAATFAAAHEPLMAEAHRFIADVRLAVLRASARWPAENRQVHNAVYRLVYGGRAAIEEAMVQHKGDALPAITRLEDIQSATPSVVVEGIRVHSGDIILSRGNAPTSALIARGNSYPGNYSHVALVHVDSRTGVATVAESLIEYGAVLTPAAEFLKEKRHRLLLLRLRPDNPVLQKDPLAPARAADYMLNRIKSAHIPYDFNMNWTDATSMFCSEVVYHAYRSVGIDLWADKSKLEAPGLTRWLGDMGVTHFITIVPSDIEYDLRIAPVAEWRNLETLQYDRLDNAVLDVLLESAESGSRLGYSPLAVLPGGITKLWSELKLLTGAKAVIPEGMSIGTALRVRSLSGKVHPKLRAAIADADADFLKKNGYHAPYWTLVVFARQALARLREDLKPGLTGGPALH